MLDRPASEPVLQRARGIARVGFGPGGRLDALYQSGCAKVMVPRDPARTPEAVFINTAGGLTGGDVLSYAVSVAPGMRATAASQTAERVYRSSGGTARLDTSLCVGAGGHLDWLPQETILFEGGALARRLDLALSGDASATLLEAVVLGRAAMGEVLDQARLDDRWRITRDGRLIHAEALRLAPPLSGLRGPGALGSARAMATLVHLGPQAEDRLAPLRALAPHADVTRASSAMSGRLITRFLAPDAQPLRRALIDILTWMRGRPLPRVWTM